MSEQRTHTVNALKSRLQQGRDMAAGLMESLRRKELLNASVDAVRHLVSPVRFEQSTVAVAVVPHAPHKLNRLFEVA